MENELQQEKNILKKRHTEMLNNIKKEYENEQQIKKEKCAMQLSKYMSSGQSLDSLDENEEKREIKVTF